MNTLLILVPGAPLIAAFLTLILGRRLPKGGAWFPVAGTGVSLLLALLLPHTGIEAEVSWFTLPSLSIGIGLRIDPLSWYMCILVAAIALIVNLYAVEYMQPEGGSRTRFYTWMSFFAGAMLTLVLADSLLLLFASWELVGLASWGLIGFYYTDEVPRRSAQIAFLMTRLGDLAMLLGWLLIVILIGNTSIHAFLAAVAGGKFEPGVLTLIALLFFAAAAGKSAQLPLTAWLPEAMAGPTPVSALLHSATMVAAGVYLVLRFYPLFQSVPVVLEVVLWTGAITAIFAAVIATAQMDLKRILAWSTVSQLGEMMMALGLGSSAAALYHLSTHAVYKSGLFLAAGAVERATGAATLDQMGGLRYSMPLFGICFAADALALAGLPPFSGYWSEDKILAAAARSGVPWAIYICLLVFLAGAYIGRAAAGVFLRWPSAPAPAARQPGKFVLSTTAIVAVGALLAGVLLRHPIESMSLARPNLDQPDWAWRFWEVLASVLGLSLGTWRALTSGPKPTFARSLNSLAARYYGISVAPAQAMLALSRRMRPEEALDRAATAIAKLINASGLGIQKLEAGGFAAETDRLTSAIWHVGGRLRGLETGKVYTYTGTIFLWTIFVICIFALIWR